MWLMLQVQALVANWEACLWKSIEIVGVFDCSFCCDHLRFMQWAISMISCLPVAALICVCVGSFRRCANVHTFNGVPIYWSMPLRLCHPRSLTTKGLVLWQTYERKLRARNKKLSLTWTSHRTGLSAGPEVTDIEKYRDIYIYNIKIAFCLNRSRGRRCLRQCSCSVSERDGSQFREL